MKYALRGVTPDGKKFETFFNNKKRAEATRKAALDMGFLRASVKKIKEA